MRLLNTETFQLQEYYTDIPAYAILSHTWDKEEVTFRDMQNLEVAKKKAGFAKIRGACAHARKYACKWIWIDSCCINKESSAKLSEAINSMYEYYGDSQVCYAYLSDASSAEDPRDTKSGFRSGRWFKRGWTLQELLAPRYVVFLGQDWEEIGTRWSLKDAISVLTRIPSRVFEDGRLESYSIAQRMSWAALRETTRPEDKAYCLMGIFGVNMPPLYGEGSEKAFTRLQHEIIKVSDDRSIFAWIAPVGEKGPRGLFARSPFEFRMSGEVSASETNTIDDNSSYFFANNGLHIYLPLQEASTRDLDGGWSVFVAALHCRSENGDYISVYLQNINGRRYVRYRPDELVVDVEPFTSTVLKEVVVKETQSFQDNLERRMAFNRIAFNIKPCNSQNHLTFLRASSSRNLSSFSDHRAEVAPNDDLFLEYQVEAHPTADHVTVRLINTDNSDNMPPFRVMVRPQSKFSARHSGHRLTDRIVLPLVNGNMLLFKNQMTGNATERILEIFSFPPDNAALMKQLVPPVGGFMVPVRTKGLAGRIARLQRLSSSSFFDIDYGPDQRYLSIHDPTSRILTYRISWHDSTSATFDVALGLEGGAPWVYIAHHGQTFKIDEEKPNLDLSAYLELLTRQRSQFRSSASLTIFKPGFGNAAYVATVTVGPRTNLQLGSHRLDVDFVLGGGGG